MEDIKRLESKPLRQLFDLGGLDLVSEMLELFNKHASDSFSSAEKLLRDRDFNGVSSQLHSVKSSLGNVGAVGMYNMVKDMEELIHSGETSDLMSKLDLLKNTLPEVVQALESSMQELNANN